VQPPARPRAPAQVLLAAFEREEPAVEQRQAAERRLAQVEAVGAPARSVAATAAVSPARPEQAQAVVGPAARLPAQVAALATAPQRLAQAAAARSHPLLERRAASP